MIKEQLIELVKRTASSLDKDDRLTIAIYSMGLPGEITEAINANLVSEKEFKTELADVVWYTVALSVLLGTEHLLDKVDFDTPNVVDGRDAIEYLHDALFHSLSYLEKAKKYVRDYPHRSIEGLYGYIEPLRLLGNVFNLSDSFDILNEKLGVRYPNGFVINPVRE